MENMSWKEAKEQLRKWREENERKSEEVVDLWISCLAPNISKLGDEKWVILEQVSIAALDIHNMITAEDAIIQLKERFPQSERVKLLQVLRFEAFDRYGDAIKGLDGIISRDPTNSAAYKRKISILKEQGKNLEAIKELSDYLNKFQSDQEGWSELCDLYLAEAEYSRAAFCAEELVLHNPHNFFVHQRLAEIRYTMGGIDNLKLALAYYCQALKLNAESKRALLGIFLTSSNLCCSPKLSSNDKKEYSKLLSWSGSEVSKGYSESKVSKAGNEGMKAVLDALSALQIG